MHFSIYINTSRFLICLIYRFGWYGILKTIPVKKHDNYEDTSFVDLQINENKYCKLSFDNIYTETLYKSVPIISICMYEYYEKDRVLLTDLKIIHI